MDAISEQMKEVLSSLQDVKVKQTIFESKFLQPQSNQEIDFTFDEKSIFTTLWSQYFCSFKFNHVCGLYFYQCLCAYIATVSNFISN